MKYKDFVKWSFQLSVLNLSIFAPFNTKYVPVCVLLLEFSKQARYFRFNAFERHYLLFWFCIIVHHLLSIKTEFNLSSFVYPLMHIAHNKTKMT